LSKIGVKIGNERLQVLYFEASVNAGFPKLIYPEGHENTDHDDDEFADSLTPI
jgi:hypothetical protein